VTAVLDLWGTCDLPESVAAPALARRFVEQVFTDHGIPGCISAARLMSSEAVTNAVLHAHSTSTLRIQHDEGTIRVLVSDHAPDWADEHDQRSGGGRGLIIIDLLSSRWGVDGWADGKTIWFEMIVDSEVCSA
jgi:anti-sigma regulatory factor (Ser/Thr protein kinase)